MTSNKIRIAFIKYGGLSAGGTEKFLQTIATNLNPNYFDVTYFYCDATPCRGSVINYADSNPHRATYLKEHEVKTVKFNVTLKDLTSPFHKWIGTDFWEKFNEADFDIIQTGRAGHKEFPFNKIKNTPIVDSIHLTAGVDNQYNISRVMHISQWSANKWVKSGGDQSRIVLVSHPMEINALNARSLRDKLKLASTTKIFGFHQRNDDDIFSPIPLDAYKEIENENTHFMIMGGSNLYRQQAAKLGLKHITFINHSADQNKIYSFLKTLNIYAHGRRDGEVNSTAMAEAMYFGLPIVSHKSEVNNGHIECIADAGTVVDSAEAYTAELQRLKNDPGYYALRSSNALRRFAENYELHRQMQRIEDIYKSVMNESFPYPIRRFLCSVHWTQNIRIWLKWFYLKIKYLLRGKI